MNLRAILTCLVLAKIFAPTFVVAVSSMPSDPCQYTSNRLYGSTVETSFAGEIFPIANNPSSESLVQFQPLTRCFIPTQLEEVKDTSGDPFSIRTLVSPTHLSASEQHFMCLFGCLRILYLISTFENEPTEEEPIMFYVLIVSERKNTSCITTNTSNRENATDSIKQSDFRHDHEQQYPFDSTKTLQKNGITVSNSRLQFITPETPKFIQKCIPTEEYPEVNISSGEAMKSESSFDLSPEPSPDSSPEKIDHADNGDAWMPSLQYKSTASICSKVFDELVHRFDLVQEKKTFVLDYKETVMGLVPKDNRSGFRQSSNETLSHLTLGGVCYVTSLSTSVHAVSSSFTDEICQFGCVKQYWKYEQTGDIVLFLYSLNCRRLAFKPCTEDLLLNPTLGRQFFFLATPNRKPIAAIIHVTDPDADREKVIDNAIRRLQGVPGFGSIPRSDIYTEVKQKGKFTYRVILRFNLTFLEY